MALIKLNNQSLSAITSAGLPSGTVLQVVQAENTIAQISVSSTSFTASGHLISITPKSSSSKLLVSLTGGRMSYDASPDALRTRLYRKIGTGSYSDLTGDIERIEMNSSYGLSHSVSILDSPSTTSTVSYQAYIRSGAGNLVYYDTSTVDTNAMFTIMEIAG